MLLISITKNSSSDGQEIKPFGLTTLPGSIGFFIIL